LYLSNYKNTLGTNDFLVIIEDGFYSPFQMSTELTNRFNQVITSYLSSQLIIFDAANGTNFNTTFLGEINGVIYGGYQEFVIVYNEVQQNLWFGNRSSSFSLTQNIQLTIKEAENAVCTAFRKTILPETSNFGLPYFLGLNTCNLTSTSAIPPVTRFYYGDVNPGDNGYWLTPNPSLTGATTSYIIAPFKLNNMGPAYFYMDIKELNCIDETSPYNFSTFTEQTNQTNSVVNSSFAKIPITSTPLSQYYDNSIDSYKYFNPPLERIKKLTFRFRYHNGLLVDFQTFPFTFTLEFTLLRNQLLRNTNLKSSYLS
jgi:hypothetical protein